MQPHRRAAWHAYLAVATQLLPALRRAALDDVALSEQFAALSEHLAAGRRWWGVDGERMSAIAARADAMHHCGDHTGAAVLLRALAVRLFAISSSIPTASCDGRDSQ
ncbi:hypothetical protein ACFQZ4_36965 [Catellatospora coxensis]|uniref:Uncharacterized protein n=1 Tax=Catellatospora coxensis TaxID=310354 RepID=A0A8J3P9S8_9ACTN|nr:hypothetical protein [Catellatospora coxensis]GIG08658.1 hypothetical protein Cco03nite_53580 [Catellatospora coxensis]